ncbi:MAG: SMC-Scp complex subunit ScpB [Pseudonocardiaceae bacterium]|nr:MAG: SMC-Scp complex subunit ScpB [Pseudonocardiaceae bacterium]
MDRRRFRRRRHTRAARPRRRDVTRSHPDTTAGDAPGGVDGAPDDVTRADGLPSLDTDTDLDAALEALLLVVDDPTEDEVLASALGEPVARIRVALQRLSAAYTAAGRGIDLRRVGGGWRFYTRDVHAPFVERMLLDGQRARLTRAALETLAIVAYRQPVTRARVAAVRGVNCDGVLRTLLTRGLVEEAGVDPQTQGTLFRTTELFLERLGLDAVTDLPPLAPLLPDVDSIDALVDGIDDP